MPRILIVDDHEIVREGVRHILDNQDDWEIAGEATNGEEALRLYPELNPDAVLMDITMPVLGGLDATRELTRSYPDARVVIFTMHESPSLARTSENAGARGLLCKSAASSKLTPALKTVIAGGKFFN